MNYFFISSLSLNDSFPNKLRVKLQRRINMHMFLSDIEYLLECNTLAELYLEEQVKVTEYNKTRTPFTGTKKVATKLAPGGPFVYGQHLMILALD
ncbi:hypothetical protein T10_10724 [Trichinella papuae]|uniref:Uncharacterized protein n=1 Tax=Trichinella papuae TaxID=268474 RepID=A0A0V1N3K6_9BILA|nr:hypothetical protein T10_10724 [Trichinella papuae]